MKITLITVCYNSEKTISDTLESVLKQTYKNYEYIIVDGKSKDKTIDIIKEYEKKFNGRLKWISEKDKGLYDAMNKGVSMATGDVIGILNSDDILAHENVFKLVADNIGEYDGIYSNLLMLNENLIKPYRLFKSSKVKKRLGWHPPHPTLYLKKAIYNKYGNFNLNYRIAADLDFMLRIINNNVRLKYVDSYFVFMRSGGASTAGLKGYYKNFKESYQVLKNNKVNFPLVTNTIRIGITFFQRLSILRKKEIFKATHLSKKPKLIQINTVCNGSTGKIMGDIQREANKNGYQTLSIYGRRKGYNDLNCIKVGGFFSFWFHVLLTTIFDKQGYGSYFKTKKVVKILRSEKPDIIHLHNIHGYYLNFIVLFKYLKNEYDGKVFWTFHDCWSFTGHCPHFILAKCNKWQSQCYSCPNKKLYPTSLFIDSSKSNYKKKQEMFTGVKNLTIITPSDWLHNLVSKSFLKDYKIITVHNGIDLNVFKETIDDNIKKKYSIYDHQKIILGVASIWDNRKGLKEFINLSKKLDDSFKIVLVGLSQKQIKKLPPNIVGIKRTENKNELVKLYSIADVFINPSKEETFSLVTLEALACHTPVIVPDNTPMVEFVTDSNGIIYKSTLKFDMIQKILSKENYNFDSIKNFDNKISCLEIIKLYKSN